MKITLELGGSTPQDERRADLHLPRHELSAVHLHLAQPEQRNRTGLYMRRHGPDVGPNDPFRCVEPPKLPIPNHLEEMFQAGTMCRATPPAAEKDSASFGFEPARFVVPVSDLVANLLRPCYHRDRLGNQRLFHFDEEPIAAMTYWCACYFYEGEQPGRLEFRWVRFDPATDSPVTPRVQICWTPGLSGRRRSSPWSSRAAPSAAEIAPYDYDLRQILGRDAEEVIRGVYKGWFGNWQQRVTDAVAQFEARRSPFARFYHSVLGLDAAGNILIRQVEANLPGLAATLAAEGWQAAGQLDSGGSCALYDGWLGGYLNHGWYFREPRGSVLVFESSILQRLPQDRADSWIRHRRTFSV